MLFSEPKIPQSVSCRCAGSAIRRFSALQRAENSSIECLGVSWEEYDSRFQCSSASRKFLNRRRSQKRWRAACVSVLFSEPKIPQLSSASTPIASLARFSALQRAENSSIPPAPAIRLRRRRFSALQRAENSSIPSIRSSTSDPSRFSALQRAENSSIGRRVAGRVCVFHVFQCSSASRKFLNEQLGAEVAGENCGFSALQRAENSSMLAVQYNSAVVPVVSVLFSEPKIPQSISATVGDCGKVSFSALQRAENSSIRRSRLLSAPRRAVSVLFSEPKIPQYEWVERCVLYRTGFSALQRAENSSMSAQRRPR